MLTRFCIAGGCALFALSLLLTAAEANGPVSGSVKKGKGAAGTNDTVAALQQAKLLLETAIHDYDGHRAKAVGEVHHALRELAPNHKAAAKVAKGTEATTTAGQDQAQSDTKLKQALLVLNGLGEVPNAKATVHVQNAIAELNTALKIK